MIISEMDVAPWIAHWIMMVSDDLRWYYMAFNCILWYMMVFMVLDGILVFDSIHWYSDGIQLYLMEVHGMAGNYIVFYGIQWYSMELHGIQWHCRLLHGIQWYFTVVNLKLNRFTFIYHDYLNLPWVTPQFASIYLNLPQFTIIVSVDHVTSYIFWKLWPTAFRLWLQSVFSKCIIWWSSFWHMRIIISSSQHYA